MLFPANAPQQTGAKDVETLNRALGDLDLALERVSSELRAALQSLKPKATEA
ncbi:MAG: hypothetical protein HZA90_00405 [Verrucomicrobia bacterium]|nr:hypothetical protein [Verrucomicrobiota bacterium]